MTYEAWRITYQSSEQAARAAYAECVRLRAKIEQARLRLRAICPVSTFLGMDTILRDSALEMFERAVSEVPCVIPGAGEESE